MKIENTVEVDAPLDRVWALVNDIPRVAPCMPGAALTGVVDDGTYEGTVAVKLGPLRMSYKGKVTVEDIDEANHSARLAASGKDTKGAGTARASVVTRLEAAGDTHTRLQVTSDVQLTGKVASFGRGGAINDVATRLFGQFADCLRATLEAESAAGPATRRPPPPRVDRLRSRPGPKRPPPRPPPRPGPKRPPPRPHPGRVRRGLRPGRGWGSVATSRRGRRDDHRGRRRPHPPPRQRPPAPPRPPRPGPPRRWTPGAWSGP